MLGMIQLIAQTNVAAIQEKQGLLYLIWKADPIVQLTILILILFSIVCWGIIINKRRLFKKTRKQMQIFLKAFNESATLENMQLLKSQQQGPAYRVFMATKKALGNVETRGNRTKLEKIVRRECEEELDRIEYGIPFLATTASAAPFIGLFGTVWGILSAFWKIGQAGASSLAIVGPHIAEALIATAVGLAAAIPATIFYNTFVSHVRKLTKSLENFSDDLIEEVAQEYF